MSYTPGGFSPQGGPPQGQPPVGDHPPVPVGGPAHGAPPQPHAPGGYVPPGQAPPPGGYGGGHAPPPGLPPGAPQGFAGAQPQRKRSKAPWIVGGIVLLAVIAGGAVFALGFLQGSPDNLATRVPADAVLYGHLNLNPSAANKLGIQSLIDRINEAAGDDIIDVDDLLEQIEDDGDITFADIDPWLGDQIAVFATEIPEDMTEGGEPEGFAFMAAIDDDAAFTDFVEDQEDVEEWDADGRTGWVVEEDDDGDPLGVIAVDGGVALIGTVDAVEASLDVEEPLADDADYTAVVEALPDSVVTFFVDTPAVLETVAEMTGQGQLLDGAGAAGVSVSFTQGSVDITSVALTPDGEATEPIAPSALADLPAGGLLYARLPDLGAQLLTALESGDVAAEMAAEEFGGEQTIDEPPSEVLDDALDDAFDTSVEEVAGWLGDLTLMVAYDPAEDTDNAALVLDAAVADEEAAADLLDGAAELFLQDSGLDVEDGRIAAGDVSLAVDDGHLTFQVGNPSDDTLAEDEAFQAAVEGLEGDPIAYVDIPAVVRAIAPFAAGFAGDGDEVQQAFDVAAGFDSLVATTETTAEQVTVTVRIAYGQELEGVDLGDEPNPPDVELGELGSLEELLSGGGAPAEPIEPIEPIEPADPGADPTTTEPFTLGDDPELDSLWLSCEAGDFAACDDLYFASPIGSEYEDFGLTCGFRTDFSASCVEDFGGQ